jgi:hypothetical protein
VNTLYCPLPPYAPTGLGPLTGAAPLTFGDAGGGKRSTAGGGMRSGSLRLQHRRQHGKHPAD